MPEDFQRLFHRVNFETVSNDAIDVFIKFKDDFETTWTNNPNKPFSYSKLKSALSKPNTLCYFQKQKKDESNNRMRHKILVPIEDEMAVELRVGLWTVNIDTFTTKYYYFVGKCRVISFIQAPKKDTYSAVCNIKILANGDRTGTNSPAFESLCKSIEALEVPKVDVNKDKDKEIWKNYVLALKKLVRQKEQVWKIKKVGKPYTESSNNSERFTYVDIQISEKDLADQFEKEIRSYFNENELEDYGVSEDRAFIEFNSFRELSQGEKDKLAELVGEYFYEIDEKSPTHSISGEITFKYSDDISRDKVFSDIEDILERDYQIIVDIAGNGAIDSPVKNIPHIKKVVDDNFASIAEVKKNTATKLKVTFPGEEDVVVEMEAVNAVLSDLNLRPQRVNLSPDKRQVMIEIPAFIRSNAFESIGLHHVKTVFRYGNGYRPTQEIDGLSIVGNFYCTGRRLNKAESDATLRTIQDTLQDLTFRQKATQYTFEVDDDVDLEVKRDFKTATDVLDESSFNIDSSILTVFADDEDKYEEILDRIHEEFPDASIEEKDFAPSYYIQFKTDQVELRKSVISRIQNQLRRDNVDEVDYDSIRNYTRTLFTYDFKTEDERDEFKQRMKDVCSEYKTLLSVSFENELGGTTYEFIKNESLELANEKKVVNDVRRATFVFLTPQQRKKLSEAQDAFGDDNNFREGVQIGTLVRKEREKLKFRITDDFDDLITTSQMLPGEDVKSGYIKPIFPGELTNISRMIRAMKKVTEPGDRVGYPANKNLPNFLFDPSLARTPEDDVEEEKQRILTNLNEPLLKNQQKQLEAVAKAMVAKDLAIIQGPPGTGKTTVIAEIIWQTLLKDPESKILITSQTNLAVDNALERLKGKKLVRPIRIGNIEKFEDEGKVYSDKRMNEWVDSKPNSQGERDNSDNAIAHWLDSIASKSSADEEYADVIDRWKAGLAKRGSLVKSRFSDEYLRHVNVFAATCSECGSRNFSDAYQSMFKKDTDNQGEPEFDLVIMDEASKATPPELVLPLTLGKKVVIIGDHKQLPPMIDENEFSEALDAVGAKKLVEDWTREDYKISQFEKLFKNAPKEFVASLDTQFRMHEQIMNCISQFYKDQEELENGLVCGIKSQMDVPDFNNKASRWHGLELQPFITPEAHAIWVNVATPEHEVGTSYENEGEIEAIKTVLRVLGKASGFEEYRDFFKKEEDREVGIITYYMPQMQRIREAIYPQFTKNEWRTFDQHKYENEYGLPFRINTVDRFQGMERNIVIVSTVRSDRHIDAKGKMSKNDRFPYALGFARELQRVNVGFSRAKRLLIVIGNEKHFANKREYAEAIGKMRRIDISQLQNL